MGALRKAGVWLGLVADEDERLDEDFAGGDQRFNGAGGDQRFNGAGGDQRFIGAGGGQRSSFGRGDDRGIFDDHDDDYSPPARPRSLGRPASRGEARDIREADRRQSKADQRGTDRSMWTADRDEREADHHPPQSPPAAPRAERTSVRQLARPSPTSGSASYPTQDNLALAPQVQLRERAVVADEVSRRYQITTLHPRTYNEARAIGEHFRDGHPVIMNLTDMDEPDAKRLVDFGAGLAFGLRGSMERVTNRVFLLSPPNIQVSAEDKARIAEVGFFDQG